MPQPRLTRIEIQGFKTFAKRVEFDLPEGIVAFVGPNGSGKSNLVDAIRWGMGEQNPRLIRCRRSEEVVFGGGASLPPAGMAEVNLLFDNSDRWLDLDYEEVQIARRGLPVRRKRVSVERSESPSQRYPTTLRPGRSDGNRIYCGRAGDDRLRPLAPTGPAPGVLRGHGRLGTHSGQAYPSPSRTWPDER